VTETPTRARRRPEPAGEPRPTPVEDVPDVVTPAPREPAPEPQPDQGFGLSRAAEIQRVLADHTPDGDLRDDHPLSVWEAIAEVTRLIGVIPKDKRTEGGERFLFRGIDDALEALHPILGDVGLVLLPGEVVRESWDTRATAKGGTLNVARILVRYRLIGPDGSSTTGEAWGEAGDSGDKAVQKAHSQSYKTFVFQTFSIPTRQSAADEPDATHEPSRPFTGEEVARATRAFEAALAADTVEALAGIRSRALDLLPVPVVHEGTLAPLAYRFDQRRALIEQVSS
jgi:hypothetical protein